MNKKRLFFDIETSPNIGWFWRAGYKQTITPEQILEERKIICICWKWEGDDKVESLHWDKNHNDKKMLKRFIKVLNTADEVIGHNSDKYDLKWLRTRCLYHNIEAFPVYSTLDTLKMSRKMFNFNSNKLDYIAKFLNVGGKIETGGIKLWMDVVFKDNKKALYEMIEYCKNDVIILEKIYNKIKNYHTHKINYSKLNNVNAYSFSCPECGSCKVYKNKTYTTQMGIVKHFLKCSKCKRTYNVSNKTLMEYLEYKRK